MSFRIERINSEMRKSISDIIVNRVKDPRINGMVSVTSVDTAKDLKTAKVYVSIYGDKQVKEETFEGLNKIAGFVRKELSVDFRDLRVVPELKFILDESFAYGEHMENLFKEIKK